MIRKRGFRTYEEAAKEAQALLWKNRESEGELTTIEHTRKDREGKLIPFSYIEDKETGATAYISSIFTEQEYSITYLSGDEAKDSNRTYPFRDVDKEAIPFLLAIHTPIFKPTKEITPDEALTPDGLTAIFAFFGEDREGAATGGGFLTKEEVEAQAYTIETAFEYWEEKGSVEVGSLLCLPFPKALTELTGVKVKTPSDYAKGISKLLKAELTEEQEAHVKSTFLFFASEALLRYAIYEFFRTEDYSHLKKVLSSFRKFYLSPKWEEEFTLYYGYRNIGDRELFTTEEYVIAKYLSKWNANIVGNPNRLKDIADYTGTPLNLMGKAYKIKHIWDF